MILFSKQSFCLVFFIFISHGDFYAFVCVCITHTHHMYNRPLYAYINVRTYMHPQWKPLQTLCSWSGYGPDYEYICISYDTNVKNFYNFHKFTLYVFHSTDFLSTKTPLLIDVFRIEYAWFRPEVKHSHIDHETRQHQWRYTATNLGVNVKR